MTLVQTPPALLEKFNVDGSAREFRGNTVLCHIDRRGPMLGALKEIQAQSSRWSFIRKISLLPPASYHMTVFGGANDRHRQMPGAWPEGVKQYALMEDCNAEMQKRLQAVSLPSYIPIRMRMSPLTVQDKTMSLRLELEPYDEKEGKKLRDIRDRLSAAMGIRAENHDTYRFHITLGYLIDWLKQSEMGDYESSYEESRTLIEKLVPKIEFWRLEFCTFENMLHFERRMFVGA